MEETIINIIKELGFPIFVAVWLMCFELPKQRKAMKELKEAINALTQTCKETEKELNFRR